MAAERRVCSYSAGTVSSHTLFVYFFIICLIIVHIFACVVFDTDILLFVVQETNPIFLFNKEMIWSDRDPTIPKITFSIESEIKVKVEESLMMPAVFHTVASRTQLALVLSFYHLRAFL